MTPIFVEGVGGVPIAVWELGGAGPPLLVAHATGFHARCYRALAAQLADRYRVVGFDGRGHGHSGTPDVVAQDDGQVPAMGWGCFAEDALAVVDALSLGGAVAFGHSCGGAVVLLAEQRRPGTFAGIYTYEPIVAPAERWARWRDDGGHDPAVAARRRRAVFASRSAALANYGGKPPLSWLRPDVLADYVEGGFADEPDGSVRLRCDPAAEAATFTMGPFADAWHDLAKVACPTTFACGGELSDFGSEMAAALAARVPDGRMETYPNLGHLGPLEHPDQVALAMRRFFASTSEARRCV